MGSRLVAPGRRTSLLGRAQECAFLDGLLGDLRRAESRSLVLHGEAGIGKTALLEYLIAAASDLAVLRAAGVESEAELAYASLHQLCVRLLDRLERLPAPQRQALEVAFGLAAGPPPDRFLVGLGVLSLFSEVAEERPLLCIVDDVQWLDQASASALAFVTRRLLAEPVGIVFAAREVGGELQQVSTLEVLGLRDRDARELLSSVVRFTLDARVGDRIIAEARGNPLALLELPQGLTATQQTGGFGLPEAHGLTGRIEESFLRRLAALPEATRQLLLVAAAEPVGDPLLVWRAAERIGIGLAAAGAAEADGWLAIDERVTFRHPLVRSAVYRSSSAEDRRAVHRALAEATDREADSDRRAWHLAAAASGPDERVASELERSAGSAQERGGVAAAAAFLTRAVALGTDPAARARRALAAAEASFQAGAFDAALRLAAAAEDGPLDAFHRARVELLRANVAFAAGLGSDAPALLLKAATRLEPFDLGLARETYLVGWAATQFASNPAAREVLLEICSAVHALPPSLGPPRPLDLLLDGLALVITDGHAAAAATLKRAAKALTDIPIEEVLRWGWMAYSACACLWDIDGMRAISARQLQLVRDAGALGQLPLYLSPLGIISVWMGDFAGAASFITEIDNVAAAIGTQIAPYALLRLRAMQGREAETAAATASAIHQAETGGQGHAAAWAHWCEAVLYNGMARYEKAAAAARQVTSDIFEPYPSMWVLPELVEAAARSGDGKLAGAALERLAQMTQPCGTDWALGIEARCRALLSDGAAADELHREAIERLSRSCLRPDLARAHLVYGEWLRRAGRRVDAREQLRTAESMLAEIGMEAFAERARNDLLATGEQVRHRSVETRDDLTEQEQQIARFARDGLSNPEIGARLFLSPRTVEWHLRKVFTKLGVGSRRELARALPDSDSDLLRS